jgi:nitronate monooxygenase
MMSTLPRIIQGGMGAGVSHWRLAQAVARLGQLGVVSGTALDQILARRLQCGDPGGHVRQALQEFPFQDAAKRILDRYFIPGGRPDGDAYERGAMHSIEGRHEPQELCIAGNFVEVYLARQGHSNPVGINYLEKIQLPHLPSLYGAMLAGVSVVIMGAGIPLEIPAVLEALTRHQPVSYPVHVSGAPTGEGHRLTFDPREFCEALLQLEALQRPLFLPIISSHVLGSIIRRKANGPVDGFIVEGPLAGGHNAPPRGAPVLTPDGQPVYGPRDEVDLSVMRALGLPFWLAGAYGSPTGLRTALAAGAAGVQVGTAFALCVESGLDQGIRQELVRRALAGKASVFTDLRASPTGFPFKVARLEGTLSETDSYLSRRRVCDVGFLREPYLREDGTVGYRCPAEPEESFLAKGGKAGDSAGRKCLCNALVANIGMPQRLADGTVELPLVTLGDDLANVGQFCSAEHPDYTAAEVIRVILG